MYTYTSPWISQNPNGNYQGSTQFQNNLPAVSGIETLNVGGQGVVNCRAIGYIHPGVPEYANYATNDISGDSYIVGFENATSFNIRYQGGYGVVNVGINGNWAGSNSNGEEFILEIPEGLTIVAINASYQDGYGIVDMCISCISETDMGNFSWIVKNGQLEIIANYFLPVSNLLKNYTENSIKTVVDTADKVGSLVKKI